MISDFKTKVRTVTKKSLLLRNFVHFRYSTTVGFKSTAQVLGGKDVIVKQAGSTDY